jgi:replication factor C subunit 1
MISGVTKKLDYLIVGEDAGQSKLEKADELKIKQINEDQFLELICQKSGIKNPIYESSNMELDESFELNKSQNESLEKETKEIKKKITTEYFDQLNNKKIKSEESPQKCKYYNNITKILIII